MSSNAVTRRDRTEFVQADAASRHCLIEVLERQPERPACSAMASQSRLYPSAKWPGVGTGRAPAGSCRCHHAAEKGQCSARNLRVDHERRRFDLCRAKPLQIDDGKLVRPSFRLTHDHCDGRGQAIGPRRVWAAHVASGRDWAGFRCDLAGVFQTCEQNSRRARVCMPLPIAPRIVASVFSG